MGAEQIENEAELSGTTVAVLCFFVGFFALAAARVIYKLLGNLKRGTPRSFHGQQETPLQSTRKHKELKPQEASVVPSAADARPRKPGVSLKSLVKQSKHTYATQPAQERNVEHPLYLNSVKVFQDVVTGLSFSPDGAYLAAACEDRVLRVFFLDDITKKSLTVRRKTLTRDTVDVAFGAATDVFVLSKGGPTSAILEKYTFSPSGKGESLQFQWEVKDVHGKQSGSGLRGGLTGSGESLAMSFADATDLQVYNAKGAQLAGINSAGLQNHGAAFSLGGRFLGAATFTTDVRLHEVQYGREGDFRGVPKVMNLKGAHNGQIYALAFSPSGDKAVTSSKDGSWAVWNLNVRYHLDEDPKILMKRDQETGQERYRLLAFGPNGIIAAAFGTTLHFLDGSKTGSVLEVVEGAHDGLITAVEWSPVPLQLGNKQTAVLATSSLDRRVRLWRAPRL